MWRLTNRLCCGHDVTSEGWRHGEILTDRTVTFLKTLNHLLVDIWHWNTNHGFWSINESFYSLATYLCIFHCMEMIVWFIPVSLGDSIDKYYMHIWTRFKGLKHIRAVGPALKDQIWGLDSAQWCCGLVEALQEMVDRHLMSLFFFHLGLQHFAKTLQLSSELHDVLMVRPTTLPPAGGEGGVRCVGLDPPTDWWASLPAFESTRAGERESRAVSGEPETEDHAGSRWVPRFDRDQSGSDRKSEDEFIVTSDLIRSLVWSGSTSFLSCSLISFHLSKFLNYNS